MKITLATSQRAGAFIITLVLIGFIALSLSTYFLLTQGEYNSVQRSETWNSALVMAEAGVEDAMTLINVKQSNFNQLSNWTVSAVSSNNWDISNQSTYRSLYAGWSSTSGTIYHAHRSPDTNAGYYDVYVNSSLSTSSNGPSILSIGTTLWKNPGANGGSSSNGFGVSYTGNTVRKVLVQTKRDGIINANLAAIVSMDLSGNNVTADSFDSGDPYHSSWQTNMTYRGGFYYGFYPATPTAKTSSLAPDYATEPYFRKDNAYLASDGSLSVGNANICGYAITGPGLFPSIGPNGTVGDNLTWIGNGITCDPLSPANYGIQPGHARDDMNVIFQDVTLPTNTWVAATKLSGGAFWYGSTNAGGPINFQNGYIISNGIAGNTFNYTISGQVKTPILIKGTNIILYLPGGLNFSGPGNTIWIETNSDLTIYTGGDIDTTGNGNSGLNNISKYAPAFSVFGLPTCQQIKLAGSPTMTAYIYAPEADLYLVGGGGGSYYDAVGAFFCKNVKLTGNMNFHYDEALNLLGPSRGYIPSYWQEVP